MSIRVELELDSGEFTTRVLRAGQSLQTLERQVNATVNAVNRGGEQTQGFLSTMRDVSIVGAAAAAGFGAIRGALDGWVGSIIRVNAEMEKTTALMRAMSTASDSIKDAAKNVLYLRNMVKDAPYSLHALTESFTRMKSTGIDPTKGAMQALVDGVAAFGGSEDVLKRSSVALSQMAGKGVIQMEELRQQLGEAVPRATELMARSMGLSYGELIKKVSTGQLEAVSSIQAMNLEIERVYGGSARAQMQTFNGMLANTNALWQQLALTAGGIDKETGNSLPGGFMDILKTQLRDLNEFMQSSAANVLAQRVGGALSQITVYLRQGLDWVIRYRQELITFAQVFGAAFAVAKIAQWSSQFMNALSGVGAQLSQVRIQMQLMQRENALASLAVQMARLQSTMPNFGGSMATGAAAVGRLSQMATFAGGALRVVGTGFGVIAPWLPLLVTGVMAVADAFGLFSNKARDAWQELGEFGVQSMKQVAEAHGFVEQERRKLQGMDNNIRIQADMGFGKDADLDEVSRRQKQAFIEQQKQDAEYVQQRAKVAQMSAQWAEYESAALELEAKKQADTQLRNIDKVLNDQQRSYDEGARRAQKAHEAEISSLAKAHKDTAAETTRYQTEQRQQALAFYDGQIRILTDYYNQAQALAHQPKDERDDSNAIQQRILGQKQTEALEQRLKQLQASRDAQAAAPMGAVLVSTGQNMETLYNKGQKKLAEINSEIADLQAGLAGADGAAAKLAYQLAQNKYGDTDTVQVQKLTEQLIAAQKEKDRLDQLMKGKKELENDLDNLRIKNLQQIAELEAKINGRRLDDLDKIKIKANNGGYAGVAPGTDAIKTFSDLSAKMLSTQTQAKGVGDTIQNDTFGSLTLSKGQTMLDQILQITTAWTNLKGLVAGTNFGGAYGTFNGASVMNTSDAKPMTSSDAVNGMLPVVARAMLNAIASVESSGAYNIRYGGAGGSKYFTDYSQHPSIAERIPTGPNAGKTSDAAGRYQFLSSTWRSLGGGAFTPENQDAMAWKYAQQMYAKNSGGASLLDALQSGGLTPDIIAKLSGTWEGFQKSGGKAISTYNNTMQRGTPIGSVANVGPTPAQSSATAQGVETVNEKLAKNEEIQAKLNKKKADAALADEMKKLGIATDESNTKLKGIGKNLKDTGSDADAAGKHVAELTAKIKAGELDPDEKNPAAEKYKALMEAAKKADQAAAELAAKEKARNAARAADDKAIKTTEELKAREAAALKRAADPNSPKTSEGYISLQADLDKQSQAYAAFYGKDSAEYKAFLDRKKGMLQSYLNANGAEDAAKIAGDNVKLRQSLMTEGQSRQAAMNAEIDRLNKLVQESQLTGDARVALEKSVQEKIALLRQQQGTQGPLGKQMKEWSAFGDNLEKAATGWLDSGVDAIAQFVATGKMNFQQLAQSIIADITKIALKAAISSMFNKGGQSGKGGSTGKGSKAGGKSMILKMFGAAHIGGIAGATTMTRSVSPFAFAGAPRFHTGGLISGMGLGPDEVPIIAKKGEGIFTPQQMKAMGRGGNYAPTHNNVSVQSNITVNATGGTKEQNQDAADRTAKAIDQQIRMVVGDELSKQLRPGNAIYQAAKKKN